MRGLIYKENQLFFKSIDKKLLLFAGAAIVLLFVKVGDYGGMIATIMFAMSIGIQNVLSLESDEKVNWKQYQLAMPVNGYRVIASKYISVLCTVGISVLGSVLLNLVSGVIHSKFDGVIFGISVLLSVVLPLIWGGLCLPLTYWFGFRSSQSMGLLTIIPMVYLIRSAENGEGVELLSQSIWSFALLAFGLAAAIFIVSYFISVSGYERRR